MYIYNEENLNHLGITQDQLIALAMLIGTDFNAGGIKGIGPKTALKLVKQHGDNFNLMFNEAKWDDFFQFGWKEVFDVINDMPVTEDYKIEWKKVDEEKIMKLLVDDHDFSSERISAQLSDLSKAKSKGGQKGLGDFFG